jgi:hypothetical protein
VQFYRLVFLAFLIFFFLFGFFLDELFNFISRQNLSIFFSHFNYLDIG